MAKYAINNGNKAVIEHYSWEFRVQLKENTLSTWESRYYEGIKRLSKNRQFAESDEIVVTTLPSLKQGRPLLVGDTLDYQVQSYVHATQRTGGMVTTTMVFAAGEATVKTHNKKLLANAEIGDKAFGGPIKLTRYWAKSLVDRMCFVKRKATTAANRSSMLC